VRCTLKNDYYQFVLSIFSHAVACLSDCKYHDLQVQRTVILIEKYQEVNHKGAAHRNIISPKTRKTPDYITIMIALPDSQMTL